MLARNHLYRRDRLVTRSAEHVPTESSHSPRKTGCSNTNATPRMVRIRRSWNLLVSIRDISACVAIMHLAAFGLDQIPHRFAAVCHRRTSRRLKDKRVPHPSALPSHSARLRRREKVKASIESRCSIRSCAQLSVHCDENGASSIDFSIARGTGRPTSTRTRA
jgi:short subunit dehydrogenase-like uncharacterized protein